MKLPNITRLTISGKSIRGFARISDGEPKAPRSITAANTDLNLLKFLVVDHIGCYAMICCQM